MFGLVLHYSQQCQKCIQLNAFQKATNYQSGHTVHLIPFLFSFFNVKKITFTLRMQVILKVQHTEWYISCWICRKYNILLPPFCLRNIENKMKHVLMEAEKILYNVSIACVHKQLSSFNFPGSSVWCAVNHHRKWFELWM